MPKALAVFFVLLCATAAARAQFADVSAAGGPATITAAWRFHTGDDPQWASPGFDDSQWPLMLLDKPWAAQGYKGYYGFAWYRIKVKLPAGKAPLALGFREVCYANEIYADGQLIGAIGTDRPAPIYRSFSFLTHQFPLPASLNGKTVELAIRVWEPKLASTDYAAVGKTEDPSIGTPQSISLLHEISLQRFVVTELPLWVVDFVGACIGLFSFSLFLVRRRNAEYLWATLMLFCPAAWDALEWLNRMFLFPSSLWHIENTSIVTVEVLCWLLFIWRFVRIPLDRLFFAAAATVLLYLAVTGITSAGFLDIGQTYALLSILDLVMGALVFARLVQMAVKGNRDAQLLLVPFVLQSWMQAVAGIQNAAYRLGFIHRAASFILYHGSGFDISWFRVFDLLSYASVGAVLVLRFARSAERDERLSAEMEAARAVQQVIVPEAIPSVPGFSLEGIYKPAGEVGGDFFQMVAAPGGGVLAMIGDVSGKGMPAAMTVSLLVGTFRTLAHYTQSPGEILRAMNQRMLARSQGGFTTCLVVRANANGTVAAANAGHLPPYVNGEEIRIENGLPLGLAAGATYAESAFTLAPGQQLTLLTDGVVEARSAKGELFGFERAAAIAAEPAEHIAQTSQAFGQEDDITVLTLTFVPAGAVHA